VVIDVCRAFTTAAYAFAAGARQIFLVSTIAEALDLRARFPGSVAKGEMNGAPIAGFDLWNSPAELLGADLGGKTLIQRTSAGTQGMVRSTGADRLLAGSFVVAGATARLLHSLALPEVTFVITGTEADSGGVEDQACGEYLAELIAGEAVDPAPYLQRSRVWLDRVEMKDPHLRAVLARDLECCLDVNRFDFYMQVEHRDGLLVLQPVQ